MIPSETGFPGVSFFAIKFPVLASYHQRQSEVKLCLRYTHRAQSYISKTKYGPTLFPGNNSLISSYRFRVVSENCAFIPNKKSVQVPRLKRKLTSSR